MRPKHVRYKLTMRATRICSRRQGHEYTKRRARKCRSYEVKNCDGRGAEAKRLARDIGTEPAKLRRVRYLLSVRRYEQIDAEGLRELANVLMTYISCTKNTK